MENTTKVKIKDRSKKKKDKNNEVGQLLEKV